MDPATDSLTASLEGAPGASAEMLVLVYDELRRLASHWLAQEAPGQTLQPTALVHEAYLRLLGAEEEPNWENRKHFFAAAAEAMRRILVENARRKHCLKRGGQMTRLELDQVEPIVPEPLEDVLALDEALSLLASKDRAAADLVRLRYFAGLTMEEAAKVLGISQRTAERFWTYARAWLHRQIKSAQSDGQ
jgi:RNA polymerase sigma factor (TIGR02999 family)